ncbi:MAG TPA: hypothetical protein VNB06_13180 [Thermoanaerobaculia bacterium]|nr:hypothetical protein [Thermoanaerobaculia bacterium]
MAPASTRTLPATALVLASLTMAIVAAQACTARTESAPAGTTTPAPETVASGNAQAEWWESLRSLCGQAFAGALSHHDPADEDLVGQRMVMHVRSCEGSTLAIPFHVGEDRSRTWVLSRSEAGIHLAHDHRHEDGSPDVVTLYGGSTTTEGTANEQQFPADAYSRELFEAQGLPQSATNVWSMEILPGERFSYTLRRTNRHFQVDFDLSQTVEPPPAPWGHD